MILTYLLSLCFRVVNWHNVNKLKWVEYGLLHKGSKQKLKASAVQIAAVEQCLSLHLGINLVDIVHCLIYNKHSADGKQKGFIASCLWLLCSFETPIGEMKLDWNVKFISKKKLSTMKDMWKTKLRRAAENTQGRRSLHAMLLRKCYFCQSPEWTACILAI